MWRNIGVAATVAAFLAGTANRGYAQGPGGAVGGGTSAAIRDDLHHIESEVLTTFPPKTRRGARGAYIRSAPLPCCDPADRPLFCVRRRHRQCLADRQHGRPRHSSHDAGTRGSIGVTIVQPSAP